MLVIPTAMPVVRTEAAVGEAISQVSHHPLLMNLDKAREITAGSGVASQASPVAHFGLGSHKGTADITVRWPTGREQRVTGSPVNRLVRIDEEAKPAAK